MRPSFSFSATQTTLNSTSHPELHFPCSPLGLPTRNTFCSRFATFLSVPIPAKGAGTGIETRFCACLPPRPSQWKSPSLVGAASATGTSSPAPIKLTWEWVRPVGEYHHPCCLSSFRFQSSDAQLFARAGPTRGAPCINPQHCLSASVRFSNLSFLPTETALHLGTAVRQRLPLCIQGHQCSLEAWVGVLPRPPPISPFIAQLQPHSRDTCAQPRALKPHHQSVAHCLEMARVGGASQIGESRSSW